jgi:antitoxin ParD1/3/4
MVTPIAAIITMRICETTGRLRLKAPDIGDLAGDGSMANFAKRAKTGRRRIPMATMNVSLPDEMKEWVEEQANSGRFGNSSDYIRDLIRRDQEAVVEFQALVDEGLNSGFSDRSLEEIFAEAKRSTAEDIQALAVEIAKDDAA